MENNQMKTNNLKEMDNLCSNFQNSNLEFLDKCNENVLYNNNYIIKEKPSNLGNTRVSLYMKGFPIISIGKSIILPLLFILFVCIIYLIVWFFCFEYGPTILQKFFNYSFLFYLISHILSIFINPGIPTIEYNKMIIKNLREFTMKELDCSKCNICNLSYNLKEKITHCELCNICYYEHAHHCSFIGHCIAKYNKYFFYCFMFTLIIFCFCCLSMFFVRVFKCFK